MNDEMERSSLDLEDIIREFSDHSQEPEQTSEETVAEEIEEKKIVFSDDANSELDKLGEAISEIMEVTIKAFEENSIEMAKRVEPLEQVIDNIIAKIRSNHINRLQGHECTIEMGFVLHDLLNNYERISDHCSNVAGCVLDFSHHTMNIHEAIRALRTNDDAFRKNFDTYAKKYSIA